MFIDIAEVSECIGYDDGGCATPTYGSRTQRMDL